MTAKRVIGCLISYRGRTAGPSRRTPWPATTRSAVALR